MKLSDLENNIKQKKSFLCLGLDTDIEKIPKHLLKLENPVYQFNKSLIDRLHKKIIAVKINTAFYEARGSNGWKDLENTIEYINSYYPELFTIADAKRADIGNTSNMYAKAFFEKMNFDAITLAPYMGSDSIRPFLEYKNKWSIILALTSNIGGLDFQLLVDENKNKLYQKIISVSKSWGDNIMYVIGATRAEILKDIRSIIPDHFLLVPGLGAQGGSLDAVVSNGMNKKCGLLINSSRSIIYASSNKNFDNDARLQALNIQKQMQNHLVKRNII